MPRLSTFVAALLMPAAAAAQEAPAAVAVGSRVRVIAPGVTSAAVVGTVVRLDSVTLAVARDRLHDTLAVPIAAVARIEASVYHTNRAPLIAGIGAGTGFVTGLTLGLGAGDDPPGTPNGKTGFHKGLVWGGIGAVLGAVGGYFIGASWSRDRWVPATLAPARVSVRLGPGTAGVAVRLAF